MINGLGVVRWGVGGIEADACLLGQPVYMVDEQTLNYLRLTGRDPKRVDLVERYCKEQGLWRQKNSEPNFMEVLSLDMGTVTPSVAGPRRPQDRVELRGLKTTFQSALVD